MKIFELQNQFKNKKLSPVELTQDLIKVAKKNENNSFISITEETALQEAQKAETLILSGKGTFLTGIPYSLKDLFITKDIRTTAGSKMLFNYIPPYEGFVSKALKDHGGILIGKVGCDEFGMGSTNEYTPFGPVTNPYNKKLVAGGSSGGSAASVAEGAVVYSIGTDTGGSVRLPANFCSLYGLKPSYGRVSRYGQIAYASSLDQASPMANSVLDLACIMEALTEKDHRDSTNVPNKKMNDIVKRVQKISKDHLKNKIIAYSEELINGCDDAVKNHLYDQLTKLEKSGAKLKKVELPHLKYSVSVYYIIATSEASANLARYDGIHFGFSSDQAKNLIDTYTQSRTKGFGSEVKRRILLGTFSLSSGYQDEYFAKACKIRRLIYNDFQNVLKDADVFFSPVCASTAFEMGIKEEDSLKMYMNDLYTLPVNLAGLPGLAIPSGKIGSSPTGYQLIGNTFKDEELLELGRAIELLNEEAK